MSVEHIGKGYVKICVSEEELENSIAGLSQLKPILQAQSLYLISGLYRSLTPAGKVKVCTLRLIR
ncbi:hypothetical protein [Coprococcus comes]|uniref:hypothetical protein n=1 Tax=Coprococcus comes TaxID=410072 RepID=UPI002079383C|nr:hypothetical protein [Coprococcus comes]